MAKTTSRFDLWKLNRSSRRKRRGESVDSSLPTDQNPIGKWFLLNDQELAWAKSLEFNAGVAEVRRGKFRRSLKPLRSSAPPAVNPLQDFREVISLEILRGWVPVGMANRIMVLKFGSRFTGLVFDPTIG